MSVYYSVVLHLRLEGGGGGSAWRGGGVEVSVTLALGARRLSPSGPISTSKVAAVGRTADGPKGG